MVGGNITEIKTKAEWEAVIADASTAGQSVVVDFMATWCPPCKLTAPVYEQLSTKYLNLVFTKIDVDDVGEVAREAGVRAMPTFMIFDKSGEKIDEVVGADMKALETLLQKYDSNAPEPTANEGTSKADGGKAAGKAEGGNVEDKASSKGCCGCTLMSNGVHSSARRRGELKPQTCPAALGVRLRAHKHKITSRPPRSNWASGRA